MIILNYKVASKIKIKCCLRDGKDHFHDAEVNFLYHFSSESLQICSKIYFNKTYDHPKSITDYFIQN